jgi:hypothetical protein
MPAAADETDPKKLAERARIDEQLVLECVGRANGQTPGLELRARIRRRSQELPPKSVDCVLSVGGISRATNPFEAVNEAFRWVASSNSRRSNLTGSIL